MCPGRYNPRRGSGETHTHTHDRVALTRRISSPHETVPARPSDGFEKPTTFSNKVPTVLKRTFVFNNNDGKKQPFSVRLWLSTYACACRERLVKINE